MDISVVEPCYSSQVSCVDIQIAELKARRDAIVHGYCYTGYNMAKPYMDPYNIEVDWHYSIPEVVIEKKIK